MDHPSIAAQGTLASWRTHTKLSASSGFRRQVAENEQAQVKKNLSSPASRERQEACSRTCFGLWAIEALQPGGMIIALCLGEPDVLQHEHVIAE